MRSGILWTALLAFVLGAAGCSGAAGTGSDDTADGGGATEHGSSETATSESEVASASCDGEDVRFQLSFFANAQHSGWLVADQEGFFDDEGVNLEMIPGGPTVQPTLALADGSVDIGLVDFPELMLAREDGAPVTVVAGVYHADPLRYVSLPESGISDPAQLEGVRIGQQSAGEVSPELQAMLAQANLTLDDIELVPVDFGIEPIIGGEIEVGPAFTYFHAASFEEAGYEWPDGLAVLDPNALGVAMTSQVVAVNDTFLAEHPEAVACTLRAGLRGWQQALDDPEAAAEDVLAALPEGAATAEAQLIGVEETNDLVMPEGSDLELLEIDVDGMTSSSELMSEYGMLSSEPALEDAYDPEPLAAARQ